MAAEVSFADVEAGSLGVLVYSVNCSFCEKFMHYASKLCMNISSWTTSRQCMLYYTHFFVEFLDSMEAQNITCALSSVDSLGLSNLVFVCSYVKCLVLNPELWHMFSF